VYVSDINDNKLSMRLSIRQTKQPKDSKLALGKCKSAVGSAMF